MSVSGNRWTVLENWNRIPLPPRDVRSLPARRAYPLKIHCHAGHLWITRAGDRDDHLLRAGESCVFKGAGRVVIEALENAAVTVWTRPG